MTSGTGLLDESLGGVDPAGSRSDDGDTKHGGTPPAGCFQHRTRPVRRTGQPRGARRTAVVRPGVSDHGPDAGLRGGPGPGARSRWRERRPGRDRRPRTGRAGRPPATAVAASAGSRALLRDHIVRHLLDQNVVALGQHLGGHRDRPWWWVIISFRKSSSKSLPSAARNCFSWRVRRHAGHRRVVVAARRFSSRRCVFSQPSIASISGPWAAAMRSASRLTLRRARRSAPVRSTPGPAGGARSSCCSVAEVRRVGGVVAVRLRRVLGGERLRWPRPACPARPPTGVRRPVVPSRYRRPHRTRRGRAARGRRRGDDQIWRAWRPAAYQQG